MDGYDVGKAFRAVEEELIASMIRNMKRHRAEEIDEDREWAMWQVMQLESLERYKRENREKFQGKFADINNSIDVIISAARAEGNMDQEIKILEAIRKGYRGGHPLKTSTEILGEFFRLNDRKLEALVNAAQEDFQKAEHAVLRMADDQYRQVIFNAQMYANTGAGTYEKAVDMATKDFLSRGLTCIQYANGARHTIADYASMAIRTASKRAYLTGEGEKRKEWNISTVILKKRGNACPKCLPYVGKVLIDDVWSGGKQSDGPYLLMSSAIAAGLYHPNCKDIHTTYFEGISRPGAAYTKEELEQVERNYCQEQKQQYAQRQEERFGRLAKYSLDPENRERYRAKREEWERIQAQNGKGTTENISAATEKYFGKSVVKPDGSDIIESGARITDLFSREADEFAEMYYKEIRSFSTDTQKIARNLGKKESDIRKVKAYLFEENSLFDPDTGQWRQFDPDCAIAQSWQRLMAGKDIKAHDRTLIEHELLEMEIKRRNPGMPHQEAHKEAAKQYDYGKEAMEYYGNLKKDHKDGG